MAEFVSLVIPAVSQECTACSPMPWVGGGWCVTRRCPRTGTRGWAGVCASSWGTTDLTNRQLEKELVNLGIGKSSKSGHSSSSRCVFYCSVGKRCQATGRFSLKKNSLLYIFFYFILGIQLALNNNIFIFLCLQFWKASLHSKLLEKRPLTALYWDKGAGIFVCLQ